MKPLGRFLGLFVAVCVLFSGGISWAQTEQVRLALKGMWPGYPTGTAQSVAVSGRYAYCATAAAGVMVVLDISEPTNPQRVGGYVTNGDARGIAVAGSYA